MFYKISKKLFKYLNNFVHFLQITLVFLSFSVVLYWIFELAQAPFIAPVAPFFEAIKNITHLFYNRTVAFGEESIDFSFLVFSLACLLTVFGLKFVIEGIESLEKKYDKLFYLTKKTEEKVFNAALEMEYSSKESKQNNFILLVNFSMLNLAKNKIFSKDFNEGVDEKRIEILNEFFNKIELETEVNKKRIQEGVLLNFHGSENIERIISYIEDLILQLRAKYMQEKWQINFLVIIETYMDKRDFSEKLNDILGLNQINLKNRIVCFAPFKQRYMLNKKQKFNIETEGVYTINHQEKDVFLIKT